MKVIVDKNESEGAVAALITPLGGDPYIVFKSCRNTNKCMAIFSDLNYGEYVWDATIEQGNVLKFYYPGDRITIEV